MTSYVPAPIPSWPRLHWRTYRGPRTMWQENLRRAGVAYEKEAYPNTVDLIARGLQLIFRFYKPAPKAMQRIADIIYKVEANIEALRRYERHLEASAAAELYTGGSSMPVSAGTMVGRS